MLREVESILSVLRESILEAKYWDGKSRVFGFLPSQGLYFTPVEKLKNGNYKGYQVDASSGRAKKAMQKTVDSKWWETSWKAVDQSEVPKTVLKKFEDKVKLVASKEPKAQETKPEVPSPEKLVTQRTARVGLRVGTKPDQEAGDWLIRRMTKKSVTIGSDSGVDVGPKFAGKTYMFRWDGTGFTRQKQYLYVVK
jgi:hypothetical protein